MTLDNQHDNLNGDNQTIQENEYMSDIEQSRLAELETVVEAGLQTFYEVGVALSEIRDSRLYRQEYGTFEDYCREKWGFKKRHVYQLISSVDVIDNLSKSAPLAHIMPNNERQVRPLSSLTPEQQIEAWNRAVENVGGIPSGSDVKQVVDDMRGIERVEPRPQQSFAIPDDIDKPTTFNNGDYEVTVTPRSYEPPQRESKPYHANARTDSEQWHSKLIWNYKRIDWSQFDHFTTGYSKRSIEQLTEILELAGVGCVIDTRAKPYSQYKPDFNKTSLETYWQDKFLYVHIPELGIHSDDREDLHETLDYESLWQAYDDRVFLNADTIDYIGDDLQGFKCVFLCVELDPDTCHRNRIANDLETMGFKVFDL